MRSTVERLRSARVVISPATTARSVVTRVSQATRLVGSAARQWSRMASLIWSATLSGWPMDTDSLVNRYRSALSEISSNEGCRVGRLLSFGGLYDLGGRRGNCKLRSHRARHLPGLLRFPRQAGG